MYRGLLAALAPVLLGGALGETPGSCAAGAACDEEVSLLQRIETLNKVSVDEYATVLYADDPPGNVCDEVGAQAWLSESGINSILAMIFPRLTEEAATFDIPNSTGNQSGWTYNSSGVTLLHYDIDVPTITLQNNLTIGFTINTFHIDTTFLYSVQGIDWWNSFIAAAGTIRAELILTKPINGKVTIKVTPENKVQLHLNLGDVKFKLGGFIASGSIFDGLIEFLVSIFQDKVEELINDWAVSMLEKAVNEHLNKLLEKIDLNIPLPFGSGSSDMAPCYVEVGDKFLAVGVKGAIVDPAEPKKVARRSAPTKLKKVPPKTLLDGGAMMAVVISSYTPNSGLELLQAQGMLDKVVRQSDLGPQSTLRFDAARAQQIVPQLVPPTPGAEFRAHIVSDNAPVVSFKPGHVEITGHMHMSLQWDTGATAEADGVEPFLAFEAPFIGEAKLQVTEGAHEVVHVEVQYVSCAPITIIGNNLDHSREHLERLVSELGKEVLVPYIDGMLEKGLDLPSSYGMHLAHSKIEVGDGDLQSTSDVVIDMDAFKAFAKSAFSPKA